MKRRNIFITLVCMLCSCIVGFFVCGCTGSADLLGDENNITITGFDVKPEVTVNAGYTYTFEIPVVKEVIDGEENLLDVIVAVEDSQGHYVEKIGGSFFALDGNGYIVTYSCVATNNQVITRETKVNVVGNYYITLNMDRVVEKGDTVNLSEISHKLTNPSFEYSVKFNGSSVEINANDEFVCDNAGYYDCTITAVDDYHSAQNPMVYEFQILAKDTYDYENFGLVEEFDQDWESIREFTGLGKLGWRYTNTAESGLTDYAGGSSDFICFDVSTGVYSTIPFYLNAEGTAEYFESLANQGYTAVRVWVYAKDTYYYVENYMLPETDKYTRWLGTASADKWTSFDIPLVRPDSDTNSKSKYFVDSFDYYRTQITPFLRFSGNAASAGQIYLGSIYAIKKVDNVTAKTSVSNPKVGESCKLSEFFNLKDYAVKFNVTSDKVNAVVSQNESFTFTSNGTYTITAVPERPDYYVTDTASVTIEVSDAITLAKYQKSFERKVDETSKDIYMKTNPGLKIEGIDATLMNEGQPYNGEYTLTITDNYGTTYVLHDEDDEYFTVNKDGCYTLTYEIEYSIGDLDCSSTKQVFVDVWSTETKYMLGSVDNMAVTLLDAGNVINVGTSGVYSAGGINNTAMYEITANTNGVIVALKPFYSKAYYASLLNEISEAEISETASIDVFVDGKASGSMFVSTSGYTNGGAIANEWKKFNLSLSRFIAEYDNISDNYDYVSSRSGLNLGYPDRFNAKNYFAAFWTITSGTKIYFTDLELDYVKTSYKVESYLETGTDTKVFGTPTTAVVHAKTGTSVYANVVIPDEYYFDQAWDDNVLEGVVSADGNTTIKIYYRRMPLYTVEYYVIPIGGNIDEAKLRQSETHRVAIGSNVTANTAVTFPYTKYNAQLSTISATIPHNDSTVLKVYYNSTAKDVGMLDKTVASQFGLADYLNNDVSTYTLNMTQLYITGQEYDIDVTGIIDSDYKVNYGELEGVYVISASCADGTEYIMFEPYNSLLLYWNEVSSNYRDVVLHSLYSEIDSVQMPSALPIEEIEGEDFYKFEVSNGLYKGFTILPVHSLEYYKSLCSGKKLKYDFKFDKNSGGNLSQFFTFSSDNTAGNYASGTKYTIEIDIVELVTHLEDLKNPVSFFNGKPWDYRGLTAMAFIIEGDSATINIGNFRVE